MHRVVRDPVGGLADQRAIEVAAHPVVGPLGDRGVPVAEPGLGDEAVLVARGAPVSVVDVAADCAVEHTLREVDLAVGQQVLAGRPKERGDLVAGQRVGAEADRVAAVAQIAVVGVGRAPGWLGNQRGHQGAARHGEESEGIGGR